ncbi:MAG: hypothetical protein V3U28_01665, partial [Candidatus Acidoferrales bacterium]
ARHSKRKISPVRVMSPGAKLTTYFFFPRELDGEPVIGPDEKKVKFVWEWGEDKKIEVDFDLRKMVRDGQPDL